MTHILACCSMTTDKHMTEILVSLLVF
uniref:Uncharacterized protein n=1 Tax=Arundo donax TaxID=35708 RepID=A0A0A9C2X3_ARUDO